MPIKIEKPLDQLKDEAILAVNAKAGEIILARIPLWKQNNLLARMAELQDIRIFRTFTSAEELEFTAIKAEWDWVKSIRTASNIIVENIQSASTAKEVYEAKTNPIP